MGYKTKLTTPIFIAFAIFFITFSVYGQTKKDSLNQMTLFNTYKPEFEKYEQQYGKYIQTKNAKMHYLEWGNPKNPTLIWVHGTYSNAYEIYEIAEELVKMNLHVIAIDYYGHGFTEIPKKNVSIYEVADDIKFLMDEQKIKQAIIGGWSRGGTISSAFYDSYPASVQALILEDGGSVAWDHNVKASEIQKDIEEIKQYYSSKKPLVFNSEFEAYWYMYNNWNIKGKQGEKLKKEMFTSYARIKKNEQGKFEINPGAEELTGENTAEENIAIMYTPFTSKTAFGASTHQLNPKIIYRNLDKPMLIFDPISRNDWFDFKIENENLTKEHPQFITHKVYEETWHGVKDQKTQEVLSDIKLFLKKNKLIK